MARALGVEPHAWQVDWWAVAGELVEHPTLGVLVPAYRDLTLSVGRRAGKTFAVFVYVLTGMMAYRGRRAWFTQQDRSFARLTLTDEWKPMLAESALGRDVRVRESNGSESVSIPANNSVLRLFAPTPASLHSAAGDAIVFSEGWAHRLERGLELERAARPLTATRPYAQIIYESAAGDVDSTWWLRWLERGRDAAAADIGHGLAHYEWTLDGTGLAPDDPASWHQVHPGGIDLAYLRQEFDHDADQFARAWLNQTDRTGTASSPIDLDAWPALATDAGPLNADTWTAAVACSPEQASTVVVACTAGGQVVRVLRNDPGYLWAFDYLVELIDGNDELATVALDPGSPAGVLVSDLEAVGVPLRLTSMRDAQTAAAAFVEAVRTASVRHVPDPSLDAAVAGARRRKLGDGGWLWGRERSDTDVAPLEAAGLARWAHPELAQLFGAIH